MTRMTLSLMLGTREPSTASMAAPFRGRGRLASVSFSYRFVVGYGGPNTTQGASLSLGWLTALDCPGTAAMEVLYTSPRWNEPRWDACHECYSEPMQVNVTGLDLDAADGGALTLRFDNGDHNLQLLLPLSFTLGWR